MIALASGQRLDEHESPGEATLQVLHGSVRLTEDESAWDGSAGDLLVIPLGRHGLEALEDSVVLLTVAVQAAGIPQPSFSLASGGARDGERFREESFDLKIENRPYLDMLKVIAALSEGKYPVLVRSVTLKGRYEENANLDGVIRVGYLTPR